MLSTTSCSSLVSCRSQLLTIPSQSSLRTLTTLLKSLYMEPNHPAIFQKCVSATLGVMELDPDTKRVDIRDVLISNVSMAWNIKHDRLLLCFAEVVRELVKGQPTHLLIATLRAAASQDPPSQHCLDVYLFPKVDRKTKTLLENTSVMLCRLMETRKEDMQEFYHHYLRQAMAIRHQNIYSEALLGYYNHLCTLKQGTPVLNLSLLLMDASTLLDRPSFRRVAMRYCATMKGYFDYMKESVPQVFARLGSMEEERGGTMEQVLKTFTGCLLDCTHLTAPLELSMRIAGDSPVAVKMKYFMGLVHSIATLAPTSQEAHLACLHRSLRESHPYLGEYPYLQAHVVNCLQERKNVLMVGCTEGRWIEILEMQTLLVMHPSFLQSSPQFLTYMPFNLERILASLRTNHSKDRASLFREVCQHITTVGSLAVRLWGQAIKDILPELLTTQAERAYSDLNSLLDCPIMEYPDSPKQLKGVVGSLMALREKPVRDVQCIYFNKTVKSLFLKVIVPLSNTRGNERLLGQFIALYARHCGDTMSCSDREIILKGIADIGLKGGFREGFREGFRGLIEPVEMELLREDNAMDVAVDLLSVYGLVHRSVPLSHWDCLNFVSCMVALRRQKCSPHLLDLIRAEEHAVLKATVTDYLNNLVLVEAPQEQIPLRVSVWCKQIYYLVHHESTDGATDQPSDLNASLQQCSVGLARAKAYLEGISAAWSKFPKGGCLFTVRLYDIPLPPESEYHTLVSQLDQIISLAYKCDLPSLLWELITLQCSFLAKLESGEALVALQLAKLGFFKYIHLPHLHSALTAYCTRHYHPHLALLLRLQIPLTTPSTPELHQKSFKVLYLISQHACRHRIKIVLSYLSAFVWSKERHIHEKIVNQHTLFTHPYLQIDSLTNFLTDLSHYADRLISIVLEEQLECILKSNQSSFLKNSLKFTAIYLLRSGYLRALPSLVRIYALKGDTESLQVLRTVDSLRTIIKREFRAAHFKPIERVITTSRKSVGPSVNVPSIRQALLKSVDKCGMLGAILCEIVLTHLQTHFDYPVHEVYVAVAEVYVGVAEVYAGGTEITACQSHSQLHWLLHAFDSPDEHEEIISWLFGFVKFLSSHIYLDYLFAVACKSYIGHLINKLLTAHLSPFQNRQIDQLILQVAVIFLDHTDELKRFQLSLPSFTLKDSFADLTETVGTLQHKTEEFLLGHWDILRSKIHYLSSIKQPLSLLFPLGDYLFNLSLHSFLLVTFVAKTHFEDYFLTLSSLIEQNTVALNDKTLTPAEWWKGRDRVNRQIGKILAVVNLGVFDAQCGSSGESFGESSGESFDYLLEDVLRVSAKLGKFINCGMPADAFLAHLETFLERQGLHTDVIGLRGKIELLNQLGGLASSTQWRDRSESNILICPLQEYMQFPFEGTPQLKIYEGRYRITSVAYLIRHQTAPNFFNICSLRYLANTSQDLPETQNALFKIKENFPSWEGIIGRKPSLAELQHLFRRDLFLFMGHGAGTSHLPEKQLLTLHCDCLMMLLGCSSARMVWSNSESHGTAHNYLLRGCTSLLGCLWDVTDKDVDRLTGNLFAEIGPKQVNLSAVLERCKKKCRLQYLNGSALVLFGLPTYLHRDDPN